MPKPILLSCKEAAEYLGVSPKSLDTWRCTKKYDIPYVKFGGVRYDQADLDRFLESRKVRVNS